MHDEAVKLQWRDFPNSTLDDRVLRNVTSTSSQFSEEYYEPAQPTKPSTHDNNSYEKREIKKPGQLSIQVNQRKQDRDEK